MIYVLEIFNGKKWEPTGPNWWFFKYEAQLAKKYFSRAHPDCQYRVGEYAAS